MMVLGLFAQCADLQTSSVPLKTVSILQHYTTFCSLEANTVTMNNSIDFFDDPYGYIPVLIDSYLPAGLKGCVSNMRMTIGPKAFRRLAVLILMLPNGKQKCISFEVPYITEYIDIYEKVARKVVEAFYVEVG